MVTITVIIIVATSDSRLLVLGYLAANERELAIKREAGRLTDIDINR